MERRRLWTAGILYSQLLGGGLFFGLRGISWPVYVNDLARKAANHRSSPEPAAARNDKMSSSLYRSQKRLLFSIICSIIPSPISFSNASAIAPRFAG